MSKDESADPVVAVMERIAGDTTRRTALIESYLAEFDKNPRGTWETLLKLLPKDTREEMDKGRKKPLGLFIHMDGDKPKAKPKAKGA
jgi:hypothetical protein